MRGKLIRSADRLAQEYTERAIQTIANVMDDWTAEDRDRIAAANALLDRGHGKPIAATISIPASRQMQDALSAMSDADLEAEILDQPLPRLAPIVPARTIKATVVPHHQPALDSDHDPLLD